MAGSDYYADTDPKALEVFFDIHRKMSRSRKVAMVFELTEIMIEASKAGVRMRYPDADEREVFLRATALRLDPDTMVKVYGWDPREHGCPVITRSHE